MWNVMQQAQAMGNRPRPYELALAGQQPDVPAAGQANSVAAPAMGMPANLPAQTAANIPAPHSENGQMVFPMPAPPAPVDTTPRLANGMPVSLYQKYYQDQQYHRPKYGSPLQVNTPDGYRGFDYSDELATANTREVGNPTGASLAQLYAQRRGV